MKRTIKITAYTLAGLLLMSTSCTKEYNDPSRATEEVVLNSPKGLTGVAIGLQRLYVSGRTGILYNSITANGFVSNELALRNAGNIPELQLSTGGSTIDGTNSILNQLWTNANKIVYNAVSSTKCQRIVACKQSVPGFQCMQCIRNINTRRYIT